MSDLPFVSLIIPCRSEERFVGQCLDSIIVNDYPKDQIEVLVVDGMSEDETRMIVERYAQQYSFIRLLDNPKKITSTALNIGIANAKGDIIMRMDAHNLYPPDYISGLVDWLEKTGADNVGGIWITLPANETAIAQAIAIGMSHPFGVGDSYFRIGTSEPRLVDTVPFGCYRKEVFNRIGLFDEELVRNQDDEFNHRLLKNGGRIYLVPQIVSYYYARDSFWKVWRMYYQYGYFKPLIVQKVGRLFTVRQIVPPIFVLCLLTSGLMSLRFPVMTLIFTAIILTYVLINTICSCVVAFKHGIRCGFAIFAVLPILHLSYGLGYLAGMGRFFLFGRWKMKHAEQIPMTR